MTTKIVSILKYTALIFFIFISIIACEKDFENVGGNLVNNGVFNIENKVFETTSYTKDIIKSQVDNIESLKARTSSSLALGIHKSTEFGLLKANIASQVVLPTTVDWGENPNIDAVYLEIFYDATKGTNNDDGTPNFELNNIFGNRSATYQLKVSKLETYLNKLDPLDPSKNNRYYSDKVFNSSTELYPWTNFKPSANDTVLYFNRTLLDVATNNYAPIQVEDTIKAENLNPFIRLPLDKTYFDTHFINKPDQTTFENLDDFLIYFNGLLIEAQGTDGSLMLLNLANAKMKIYFTNTVNETKNEADVNQDLNGDGDQTDTNVTYPVRTKRSIDFPLSRINVGINTNKFERDYTASDVMPFITNPDIINGEQKLYVQGAQGSIAVIDLFKDVDLDEIRNKNWLINEANLTFYIDEDYTNTEVPERLLLYKLDANQTNNINEDAQILDAITEGDTYNGFLIKDDDDKPVKYKINITDYISNVLKLDNPTTPVKLGLKELNSFDIPRAATDTIVDKYSWDPRGVVLYGNKFNVGDLHYDKRVKLEIHYTELNN